MELKIDRLRKTYPNGVHALTDVSLTIAPGMFGLLGPNGAGKSTLMRILATLQEADGGSVTLGDIDVLHDKESLRRTLGYLPQEFGLYPRVTAEEMLDHFALLKGVVNARERRETVQSLLQQTNLWDARGQRLGGFSGGMRQRFGIAVALIGNPRLIIVDEPTAGLDPAERVRFLNLLSALGENAVVLLSTHIVEDVSDLCQRMAVIRGGRILLEAVPAEAVRALSGRVWRREVPRDELTALEETHPVISTTLLGGQTMVHVVADSAPDDGFQPVEPDLKDVYFTLMRGLSLRPTAAPVVLHTEPAGPPEPIAPHMPAAAPEPPAADGADPWAAFRRRSEPVSVDQTSTISNPGPTIDAPSASSHIGAIDPSAGFEGDAINPVDSAAESDVAPRVDHPLAGPSFETVRDAGNTSEANSVLETGNTSPESQARPSFETVRDAGNTFDAPLPLAEDDRPRANGDDARPVSHPAPSSVPVIHRSAGGEGNAADRTPMPFEPLPPVSRDDIHPPKPEDRAPRGDAGTE